MPANWHGGCSAVPTRFALTAWAGGAGIVDQTTQQAAFAHPTILIVQTVVL
jgi:hypothetical protein